MDRLMTYHWPGNVRELENIVERALIMRPEGPLVFSLQKNKPETPVDSPAELNVDSGPPLMKLDEVVSSHIQLVLRATNGKVQGRDGAAAILGLNPSTLRNKMRRLGIQYGRSLSSPK